MTKHELTHFFQDEVGLCCGNPEEAAQLIRDILNLTPFYDHRDELKNLLPTNGIFYLVLSILDRLDLIEHGTGIGGSWLTEAGESLKHDLNEVSKQDPELLCLFMDTG